MMLCRFNKNWQGFEDLNLKVLDTIHKRFSV